MSSNHIFMSEIFDRCANNEPCKGYEIIRLALLAGEHPTDELGQNQEELFDYHWSVARAKIQTAMGCLYPH